MPAPATIDQFLLVFPRSGLVSEDELQRYVESHRTAGTLPDTPRQLADLMVRDGLLTRFQADQLLQGKSRGFLIAGKYKVLEHLGSGGMGSVYLCEHLTMRRRVAIKVLPVSRAKDPSYLERFYREARAVAALDHPNIVRAHDIDHEGNLHFLVMEYVDGASLQEIIDKHGPLDPVRAAHYTAQAALGLQHAHEAGLVHRDIKPGNLLLDRGGTVKVLDLGLARFFHDDDQLSKKYDETVLGTSDYVAPEQTVDSEVDIRADIYSLGATFFYLLTGQTLFGDGTAAQKLIWHQIRQPRPVRSLRAEVPEELAALVEQRMLAKDPRERFQTPIDIFEALTLWTQTPIGPPPEAEMPRLSPAACRGEASPGRITPGPLSPGKQSPPMRRSWTVTGGPVVRSGISPAPAQVPAAPTRIQTPPPSIKVSANGVSSRAKAGRPPGTAAAPSGVIGARSPQGQQPIAGETEVSPAESKKGARPPSSTKRAGRHTPAPQAVPTGRRPLRPVWLAAAVVAGVVVAGGAWLVISGVLNRAAQPLVSQGPSEPVVRAKVEVPPPTPAAGNPVVAITTDKDGRRVRAPGYEALLGTDGNLTSLRVGDVEFLKSGSVLGPMVFRGSYFFIEPRGDRKPAVVPLPEIEQSAANVLKATGDRFTITYEFGADALRLKLTNATDDPEPFFIILNPAVMGVLNDKGESARSPAVRPWPTTTWLAGPAKLTITGGDRIWGPWGEGGFQVWEARLNAYETRDVVLTPGPASKEEAELLARVPGPGSPRHFRRATYEAVVEEDGCLTSLRAAGVELLRPGVDVSRGLYLHNGKEDVRLPDITQPTPDVLLAKGDQGSLRYEFGPVAVTCTAENHTPQPLHLYVVFDPAVAAVQNEAGDWARTVKEVPDDSPDLPKWRTTTWFAPGARLEIKGGWRVWGPWSEEKLQVWDGVVPPKGTQRFVLQAGVPTPAEAEKAAAVAGRPLTRPGLTLQSPANYQVFQRRTRLDGQVLLRGRVHALCDRLEVRLTGTSLEGALPDRWQAVPLQEAGRFDHALPGKAGGWYRLELRALQGDKVVAQEAVAHVGLGEVFVGAGQSNSTNCAPERLKQESGQVATFDGYRWRPADDPQPGVHDRSGGGSYWPAFGDALAERLKVPVGVASAGHSGTSVRQWEPGSEIFRWMMTRVYQLGPHGFRMLLWHQGESDAGMSAEEYARRLSEIIRASRRDAGWDFPWMVAQVSYHNPQQPSFAGPRTGQKMLWDSGVALEGPDTDTLTGEDRSEGGRGIHFSAKGLRAHGRLWADRVAAYVETVLDRGKAKGRPGR